MSEISEPNTSSPHHRPHLGTKPSGWVSLRVAFSFVLAHVEERIGVPGDERNGNSNWVDSSDKSHPRPLYMNLMEWIFFYNLEDTIFPDYFPSDILLDKYTLRPREIAVVITHMELIEHFRRGAVETEARSQINYIYETGDLDIVIPSEQMLSDNGLKNKSFEKREIDRDIWKLGSFGKFKISHDESSDYDVENTFFTGSIIPDYYNNTACCIYKHNEDYLGWHVMATFLDIEVNIEQLSATYADDRAIVISPSNSVVQDKPTIDEPQRVRARFELKEIGARLDKDGVNKKLMSCTLYYKDNNGIDFTLTRGLVFLMLLAAQSEDAESQGKVDLGIYITDLDQACDMVIEQQIELRDALQKKKTLRKSADPESTRTGIYGNINRFCSKLRKLGHEDVARHFTTASSPEHNEGAFKCIEEHFLYDPFHKRQSTRGKGPASRKGGKARATLPSKNFNV